MMKLIIKILMICLALSWSSLNFAAPKKDLLNHWVVFNPLSQKTIDHTPWTHFLKKYVSTNQAGINVVDYGQVTPQDKQALQQYIQYLEKLPITDYNRAEQMAYWINLYNAETVALVLQKYPVKSILDINLSHGLFTKGPWDATVLQVDGRPLSLNDIEHRILRPIWNDPRIHFAVNCASLGCPNLQRKAFTSANLETMLNQGTKNYINNPRGIWLKDGKLHTSKILVWYGKDFGDQEQDVIDFARLYAKPPLRSALSQVHHISGSSYDWNLNEK